MKNTKLLSSSLWVLSFFLFCAGGVTLGAGYNSWQQHLVVEKLSKKSNLKREVSELRNAVKAYTDTPILSEEQINDKYFSIFLNLIFNGGIIENNQIDITDIEGPMWIDWNKKLAELMTSRANREKFGPLDLFTSYKSLLFSNVPEIKIKAEAIREIEPILKDLKIVEENNAAFIVGLTMMSLTIVPLTIIIILAIKRKYTVGKQEEKNY